MLGQIAPFSAVLGALVGAALTYILTRRAEQEWFLASLRRDAYIDFLNGCAKAAAAWNTKDENKEVEALTIITDSKLRISVYGSHQVATALADYFRKSSGSLETEHQPAFVKLIELMRAETSGHQGKLKDEDISMLLFGGKP